MHSVNVHILGALMLLLWLAQWAVMALGPGGFPRGSHPEGVIAKVYNALNMLTVLILMPAVAVLFVAGYLSPLKTARIPLPDGSLLFALEVAGFLFYLGGHCLLSWARLSLGASFQMGGAAPRTDDRLMVRGAYRVVRHPMYAALLCFDLGLFLMTQSVLLLLLFVALLSVLLLLVPSEEKQLVAAYGGKYEEYRKRVRALVPLVY